MKTYLYVLASVALMQAHLVGQTISPGSSEIFSYSATYVCDVVNNISGGIKKGSLYLGMANIQVGLETEPAGLWNGGRFFVNFANTHGAMPSREFIGDYQVASNIEAGDHAYIQELWFKQTFGEFQFITGVQDVNAEFAGSCCGSLFLNSSFGISPIISSNIPVSIFPLTSLGFTAVWTASDQITLRTAAYDGSPTAFEENPYNIKWDIRRSEGIINLFEVEYFSDGSVMYKLGTYHHDHLFSSENTEQELVYEHNVGIYGITDVRISKIKDNGSEIHIFSQLGFSSRVINENYWYGGLGIRASGVFAGPEEDELGLAVAHAGIRSLNDETTIELTYKRQMNKHIYLQPDIQFIHRPAGTTIDIPYSLAATIRFGLQF